MKRKVYVRSAGEKQEMSSVYGERPPNRKFVGGGLRSIPDGAQLLAVEVKAQYDPFPFHVYHPSPHDAVTILKSKKNQHDWLVCGWYIDTYREGNVVKGLLYRKVVEQADKDAILAELKKHDKEATAKFEP